MIVLDINVFPSVFKSSSSDYEEFYHVRNWVEKERKACFVFGGTKYNSELRKMTQYYDILKELKNTRQLIEINSQLIDDYAKQLKSICTDESFNDEHIVAILNVSGCKLVCTKDSEAVPYLKNRDFYDDKKAPKIYSSSKNKKLLSKKNIVKLKNIC